MAKKRYHISGAELKNLYWKKKLTTFKIAEIFGCSANTIVNWMKKYGIKRRHSGPKRIGVSKKTLYSLYIKKGLSSRKIAKICHCEQTAIINRLRKYNIPIRHPNKKLAIFQNDLRNLYIKQKLSAYKIAKIFNCDSGTVYRYLKLHKIKTRPLKRINITEDELKDIYIRKKYSLSKIAKRYNCCPVCIWKKMRKFKIPLRTISETHTIHLKKDFSGNLIEKAHIIGFRIGDLGVRKAKNLISIGCGTTKFEQVQLIEDMFTPYGPIWISKKDKRGAVHIDCLLNSSFSFLLPKYNTIPKWILKNKKTFFSFLAGYTDAEGNIGIYRGMAKLRLRSYDKGILKDISDKLNKLKIRSLFRLDRKAGMKSGVLQKKDSWSVAVHERESLLKLFERLGPFMKHEKRKGDLLKAKKNVFLRLKR